MNGTMIFGIVSLIVFVVIGMYNPGKSIFDK